MHRTDSADGSVHIYAKLAQAYARTAYACFDQPDLKSAFTFRVTAPAGWAVLSNQPQADIERTVDDSQTVRFLPTAALPTFTTTVVAGDYHVVRAEHTTPDGQRIPLELACRADLAENLDAEPLFALTAKGLDFYTGWLGAAYPYAKYGQVFVPELSCLASENAGCVLVVGTTAVQVAGRLADPAAVAHGHGAARDGAHVVRGLRHPAVVGRPVAERVVRRLLRGHRPGRAGPRPRRLVDDVGDRADRRLRRRPAAVLAPGRVRRGHGQRGDRDLRRHQLRQGRRRPAAAVGLRRRGELHHRAARLPGRPLLRQRPAGGSLAAVGEAAGKDLTAWSKAWLETPGPNVLRAEFSTDAAGRFTEFAVAQAASQRHPVLRPHRVTVGLYRRSGDSLEPVGRADVDVTGERTAVPSLLGALQPDLILLNDDDTGYVVVRFDPRSLSTVLSSVGGLPDLAARAVCWNAVIDMVRQAELPVTALAAMLAQAMRSEPSPPVLDALVDQAEWLLARFATRSQAAEARTLLEAAAAEIPDRHSTPDRPNTPDRANTPDRPNTPDRRRTPPTARRPRVARPTRKRAGRRCGAWPRRARRTTP